MNGMVAGTLLLSASLAFAGPAAEQLRSLQANGAAGRVYDGGVSRPAAAIRFQGRWRASRPAALSARTAPRPPAVGAVKKLNLPKGTYGSAPPHLGWDYDRMVFAAGFAAAGAVAGFLMGGPIGACVGFLAGFFVGALIGKATGVGS